MIKRKSLAILFSAVIAVLPFGCAFMLAPKTTAHADTEDTANAATVTVDGVEYASIEEAWAAANDAGTATVKMYADAEISSTLTISAGNSITLDLNGCMLKYAGSNSGSVIYVNAKSNTNAYFTLIDSNAAAETKTEHRYYIDSENNGRWVFDEDNGTEILYGGVICGGTGTDGEGGGVYTKYGTFTMESGTIAGNATIFSGGGVFAGGTFKMTGGEISGNTTKSNYNYGCVAIFNTFEISGAPVITGNISICGGEVSEVNVYLMGNSKITVTGELTDGAKIGVSNTGAVITGFTQEGDPANFFIPDNPDNNCVYISDTENGAVTIGTHDIITHEAQQPTCTENGLTASKSCSVCNTVLSEQTTVPALGHKYGDWVTTKEATESEDGEQRRVCENDEAHYETRTLPKLTPSTPTPEKPSAPTETKSYWWLFWLLIPLAIGVGGVTLGIWVYKNDKKNNRK